jgi:DNA-directed RNA polymerase subunit RPC12/RpoP
VAYNATITLSGLVNNIKVRCSKCGATLYVNPDSTKSGGGWRCPHCKTRH